MSIFSSFLLSLAPGSSLLSSGGWSSIIMETLKRNTCQRIRCLHLSHLSFLSHLSQLSHYLDYPNSHLSYCWPPHCNWYVLQPTSLSGSKQLDALRLANQQLCFCLPIQVTILTKVLLSPNRSCLCHCWDTGHYYSINSDESYAHNLCNKEIDAANKSMPKKTQWIWMQFMQLFSHVRRQTGRQTYFVKIIVKTWKLDEFNLNA